MVKTHGSPWYHNAVMAQCALGTAAPNRLNGSEVERFAKKFMFVLQLRNGSNKILSGVF